MIGPEEAWKVLGCQIPLHPSRKLTYKVGMITAVGEIFTSWTDLILDGAELCKSWKACGSKTTQRTQAVRFSICMAAPLHSVCSN